MGINIYNLFNLSDGNQLIPSRDPGSVTGSSFIKTNLNIKGSVREQNILEEFLHGNIPDFLRKFTAINVSNGTNNLSYLVTPDVLSIGSNSDYVRMPMSPLTAQAIADKYDCSLPTRLIVNTIWRAAYNKLEPKPWGPPYDDSMSDTYRYGVHNNTIQNQLSGKDSTLLISGHKKDVVLTNTLYPNNPKQRVAIYGWMQLNGQPIQGLNPSSHEVQYADYSHGIRLIANDVMIDGRAARLQDILSDPKLCILLSDEGPLRFQRY